MNHNDLAKILGMFAAEEREKTFRGRKDREDRAEEKSNDNCKES